MPQINLLCGDWNSDHCGKSKHKDKAFDSVIVSSASAHLLDGTSGRALVRHLVLLLILYITLTRSSALGIEKLVIGSSPRTYCTTNSF